MVNPGNMFVVERCHSAAEQGEKWVDGKVRDIVEIEPETRVRLLRKHSLRIVNEPTATEERQPTTQTTDGKSNTLHPEI